MKVEIEAESLTALLDALSMHRQKFWFSIEDCADAWGFERSYFYRRKHLLPNFGIFDDPAHKAFSKETFMRWVSVPLSEHAKSWAELSPNDRRAIERKRGSNEG
jgi:hypothetical protein